MHNTCFCLPLSLAVLYIYLQRERYRRRLYMCMSTYAQHTNTHERLQKYIQQFVVVIVHPRLWSLGLFAVFPFLSHSVMSLLFCWTLMMRVLHCPCATDPAPLQPAPVGPLQAGLAISVTLYEEAWPLNGANNNHWCQMHVAVVRACKHLSQQSAIGSRQQGLEGSHLVHTYLLKCM